MTTTSAPFGLRPARKRGSTPNSAGLSRYRLNPGGLNTSIFKGDLVKVATNGYVVVASGATDFAQGVFMGVVYNDPTTKRPTYSPFYTANVSVGTDPFGIQALVADDPAQTFIVQANASVSVGDVGWNFDYTVGTGSTFTGNAAGVLAATSRAATSKMLRIIDLYETPDNAFSDAFPLVEVQIVQHALTRVSAA